MRKKKPLIGITSRVRQFGGNDGPLVMGVNVSYVEPIVASGGSPVFVPLVSNREALRRSYDAIDGLVVPGGEDVNPKLYGEEPHEKLGKVSDLRDEVEIQLVRWAFEDDKAVLGICRGVQVINVALGGSLIQDIPAQISTKLNHDSPDDAEGWKKLAHGVSFDKKSKIAKILGKSDFDVNSLHHQSVKHVGADLSAVAKAPDGTIEAIEAPAKKFFLAVQCHPETLWQAESGEAWRKLFEAFVAAAAE